MEDVTFEVIEIGMMNRSLIGKKQGKVLLGEENMNTKVPGQQPQGVRIIRPCKSTECEMNQGVYYVYLES